MRTDTTLYQFNHGAKPRGKGNWYFEFNVAGNWTAPEPMPYGTFTEARLEAERRAKKAGACEVRVSP
jgi:hypothetical protein